MDDEETGGLWADGLRIVRQGSVEEDVSIGKRQLGEGER